METSSEYYPNGSRIFEAYDSKVIQSSRAHTGSTVVVNAVAAMLTPGKPIAYESQEEPILVKTHVRVNIDDLDPGQIILTTLRDKKRDLYDGISSERVIRIPYSPLIEESDKNPRKLAEKLFEELASRGIEMPPREEAISAAVERIEAVSRVAHWMKDLKFGTHDSYYEVHGSHRNRRS